MLDCQCSDCCGRCLQLRLLRCLPLFGSDPTAIGGKCQILGMMITTQAILSVHQDYGDG